MILRDIAARAVINPEKMGKVSLASGHHLYAGLNCFAPGQQHQAHIHADQDKLYYVVQGKGEASVGDESSTVTSGDLVLAPAGVIHSMKNSGTDDLIVMVVFSPPPAKS